MMRGGTESGGLAAVTISLSLRLRHCGVTRTGGPSHPCSGGNTQQDNTTTSAELSVLQVTGALSTYQEIKENGFRSNKYDINEADNKEVAVL